MRWSRKAVGAASATLLVLNARAALSFTMVTTRTSAAKALALTPLRRSTAETKITYEAPPTKREAVVAASAKFPSSRQNVTATAVGSGVRTVGDHRRRLLFSLQDCNNELVKAKVLARPSKRNKSPYVADVWLDDEQREALAHVPNLDMGGKCVPGATLLLKHARDGKGVKVGEAAVSPKYGTPKCEFIAQLLWVDESTLSAVLYPQPTWVGAHPSLGERIAEIWLRENYLMPMLLEIVHVQTQVRNPCGADNIRADFCVTHVDGTKRIVEVKTVVDTDYDASAIPSPLLSHEGSKKKSKKRCLFTSSKTPYTRAAIFPWGDSKQKGPDGEPVVSARAIHHVRELTRIATGELMSEGGDERYQATILFVIIRGDAVSFRPNHEACPSLLRYLKEAEQAGVQVLAKRVSWGTGEEEGVCFDDDVLPIEWPNEAN